MILSHILSLWATFSAPGAHLSGPNPPNWTVGLHLGSLDTLEIHSLPFWYTWVPQGASKWPQGASGAQKTPPRRSDSRCSQNFLKLSGMIPLYISDITLKYLLPQPNGFRVTAILEIFAIFVKFSKISGQISKFQNFFVKNLNSFRCILMALRDLSIISVNHRNDK